MKKILVTSAIISTLLVGCTNDDGKTTSEEQEVKEPAKSVLFQDQEADNNAVDSSDQSASEEQIAEREQEDYAEQFEADMSIFNEKFNNVQYAFLDFSKQLVNEDAEINEVNLAPCIAAMEDAISFIEGMQDYSESDKYGEAYKSLIEASTSLITAKVLIKNSVDYNDVESFEDGFKEFTKSNEEFEVSGQEYAKALHNQ